MTAYIDDAESAFWANHPYEDSKRWWAWESERWDDMKIRRHRAKMETEYRATGYWSVEEGDEDGVL